MVLPFYYIDCGKPVSWIRGPGFPQRKVIMEIIEPLIKPRMSYPETMVKVKRMVSLLENEMFEEAWEIYWDLNLLQLDRLKKIKDSNSVNAELAKKYYYGENL